MTKIRRQLLTTLLTYFLLQQNVSANGVFDDDGGAFDEMTNKFVTEGMVECTSETTDDYNTEETDKTAGHATDGATDDKIVLADDDKIDLTDGVDGYKIDLTDGVDGYKIDLTDDDKIDLTEGADGDKIHLTDGADGDKIDLTDGADGDKIDLKDGADGDKIDLKDGADGDKIDLKDGADGDKIDLKDDKIDLKDGADSDKIDLKDDADGDQIDLKDGADGDKIDLKDGADGDKIDLTDDDKIDLTDSADGDKIDVTDGSEISLESIYTTDDSTRGMTYGPSTGLTDGYTKYETDGAVTNVHTTDVGDISDTYVTEYYENIANSQFIDILQDGYATDIPAGASQMEHTRPTYVVNEHITESMINSYTRSTTAGNDSKISTDYTSSMTSNLIDGYSTEITDGYKGYKETADSYNSDGYNTMVTDGFRETTDGYNSDGYKIKVTDGSKETTDGYNSDGYNTMVTDGFKETTDGYNSDGYNRKVTDDYKETADGYDSEVLKETEDGYNSDGYNRMVTDGFKETTDLYNSDGFKDTTDGYNSDGYNRKVTDGYKETTDGYNSEGFKETEDGYNSDGYNTMGTDGFKETTDGYNSDGYEETADGYNSDGYNLEITDGINTESPDGEDTQPTDGNTTPQVTCNSKRNKDGCISHRFEDFVTEALDTSTDDELKDQYEEMEHSNRSIQKKVYNSHPESRENGHSSHGVPQGDSARENGNKALDTSADGELQDQYEEMDQSNIQIEKIVYSHPDSRENGHSTHGIPQRDSARENGSETPLTAQPTVLPSDDSLLTFPVTMSRELSGAKCQAPTRGSQPFKEALEFGTNLPDPCWHLLCSEMTPYSFLNINSGVTTYFFLNKNRQCFELLDSVNGSQVLHKVMHISPRTNVIVLNPDCVHSRGLAYVLTFEKDLPSISPTCKRSLCMSGSSVWVFAKLKTILVGSNSFASMVLDTCLEELKAKALDMNLTPENETVHYTNEFPESSPCGTGIVLKTFPSGRRAIIFFRSSFCGDTDTNTWFQLLISVYSMSQTERGQQLSRCLLKKSNEWKYEFSRYIDLLEDLFGEDLRVPDLPEECVVFLCNRDVEFSQVSTKEGEKIWFPYLSRGSSNDGGITTEAIQCQEALQSMKNHSYVTLSEADQHGGRVVLIPSPRWSCPSEGSKNHLMMSRAEILINLWTVDAKLSESCFFLVCRGSISNFHHKTRIFRVSMTSTAGGNSSIIQSCIQHMGGRFTYGKELAIASVPVNKTGQWVVFLYTSFPQNPILADFLSLIYSVGNVDVLGYCDNYSRLSLSRVAYDMKSYYFCSSNRTKIMTHMEPGISWYKIPVTEDIYFVVFKDSTYYVQKRHVLQYFSTLNLTLSDEAKIYINNLPNYAPYLFRNTAVFSFFQRIPNLNFLSFVDALEKANLTCQRSSEYTACYTGENFPNSFHKTAFLLFLHNCSISLLETDKIILLILTHFRRTSLSPQYLCQVQNIALMLEMRFHSIHYATRGPRTNLLPTMNAIRRTYPERLWQEMELGHRWDLLKMGRCMKLKNISTFFQLLKPSDCVYYTNNGSTILFGLADTVSYHAFAFTLDIVNQTESLLSKKFLVNLTVESSAIVHLKPTLVSPAQMLYVSKLAKSPTPPYLTNLYETDVRYVIPSVKETARLILRANLQNNPQCLRDIESGNFSILRGPSEITIGPIHNDLVESSCFLSLSQDLIAQLQNQKTTINKFWPSCQYNMIVSRSQRDQVVDWSYLDSGCKATEVAMLSLAAVITTLTVVGNVFVLTVILSTDLAKEATFLLRASLAMADLLLGAMPASLAVYDSISLMRGDLSLRDLSPDTIHMSFSLLSRRQPAGFQQLRFRRFGYAFACSFVFNLSSTVSLLSLTLMGVERLFVILGRPLRRGVVLGGVCATWLVGVVLSLLINMRQDHAFSFVGYFDPITKLTISMGAGAPSVSLVAFYFVVTITSIAGVVTMLLLITTVTIFRRNNNITKKKLSIHSAAREEEALQVTRTLLYMVALFGMSCVPLVVDVLGDLPRQQPLAHFFAWWFFLAGSSWNWALYSLSGGKFRKHVYFMVSRGIKRT